MPPPIVTVLPARHSCDELHSIGSRSPGAPRAWKTGCVRKRTFYSCTNGTGWLANWLACAHTISRSVCQIVRPNMARCNCDAGAMAAFLG
mgnify:CR=1 FL=1